MKRDPNALLETLRERLPGGAAITGLTPLSTGHSNETYLMDGLDAILRMPPSVTPLVESAHDMRTQHDIFMHVKGLSEKVPVPGVSHMEDDPSVLGAPFYVMEHVEGETIGEYAPEPWLVDADDDFRRAVTEQWADAVIAINQQPPLELLGAPSTIADELERWHAVARAAGNETLLGHFDALVASVPEPTGGPALVHGDPKPGNTLWVDGRLTAFLDWEMAFNGDPAWDLGYMLVFLPSDVHPAFTNCDLPGMLDRDALLERWRAATGRDISDHNWFEAASTAKVAALLAYGFHLGQTGKTEDERLIAWEPWAEHFIGQTGAVLATVPRTATTR